MTRIIYTIDNYDLLTPEEMDEGMDYQIGSIEHSGSRGTASNTTMRFSGS